MSIIAKIIFGALSILVGLLLLLLIAIGIIVVAGAFSKQDE